MKHTHVILYNVTSKTHMLLVCHASDAKCQTLTPQNIPINGWWFQCCLFLHSDRLQTNMTHTKISAIHRKGKLIRMWLVIKCKTFSCMAEPKTLEHCSKVRVCCEANHRTCCSWSKAAPSLTYRLYSRKEWQSSD